MFIGIFSADSFELEVSRRQRNKQKPYSTFHALLTFPEEWWEVRSIGFMFMGGATANSNSFGL